MMPSFPSDSEVGEQEPHRLLIFLCVCDMEHDRKGVPKANGPAFTLSLVPTDRPSSPHCLMPPLF